LLDATTITIMHEKAEVLSYSPSLQHSLKHRFICYLS
jgi:hypothetical protein